MKKNRKFVTFPLIEVKSVITIVTSLILISSFAFCISFISSGFITSDFVNLLLHLGIKTGYTPPETNIAQTMLTVSVPGLSFEKKLPESESPVAYTEQATEASSLPVPENDAQSITYESAEEKGYKSIDGLYINNQTSKNIDLSSLLNKELDLSLSDEPSVLILHTHTTESYTPSEKYNYIPSETDRTTDLSFNMVSVGEVIYQALTDAGINAIHDKSINDYPSYSTSYSKSLKLAEKYCAQYPSIKIVIDVHRDAIVTQSGKKMRPLTTLEPRCAQVMMVVGTNDSGLNHPLWQTNLSFALKLQHEMNSKYPSLARPINLRRERFNHHVAPYAFILEVGTNGNTLDEARDAAKLFSECLVSLLKV